MEPVLNFVDNPVYIRDVNNMISNFKEFCIVTDTDTDMDTDTESNKKNSLYTYSVLSIDIGVLHLGISLTLLDEEYNLVEIIWIDLIDITKFDHKWGPKKENCQLYHTKTFCDWLNHTYQENMDFFDKADFILVERQPPMGFVVIEQLILSRWRDKTILISPNSMHKYFNIGYYDYEKRKEYTEKIAKMNISDPSLLEQLECYDRSHDIADSVCIMLYWINKKQNEYKEEKKRQRIKMMQMNNKISRKEMSMDEWFEMHRYIQSG
jgi:hypothetical protein